MSPRTRPHRTAKPVRQEDLRPINLELVFRHILAAGRPISRTELAAATGLTRPTITRITEELLAGRLITETGLSHNGRAGRPRVGLTLSASGPAGLGLDIRADGLAACLVDLAGTVRHLAFTPSPYAGRSAADVLGQLGDMTRAALDAGTAQDLTVVTATLAVPGPVQDGVVQFAPALGWRRVDARALLREAARPLELPIMVDNEATLAALGELYAGDDSLGDFVYVSGGLGIGAGIVLEGQLMRGARGWSGELGHAAVYPDGRPCPCGARGCLAAYASLPAILGGRSAPPGLTPDAAVTSRAEEGDPATLEALDTAGTALGIGLANAINILDIDTVLLGGSFALLTSWLTTNIETEIARRVLTAAWAPVTVRPALLGPDAAVIGAALTSIDQVRRHPSAWLARGPRAQATSASPTGTEFIGSPEHRPDQLRL